MAHLAPVLKQRFFDANGDPLVGGKLYSYAAGTSTPLATYTTAAASVENANPVILDANGEATVFLGASSYKFILHNSSDVLQWSVDNVIYIADGDITTGKLADGVLTADAAGRAKMADGYLSADAAGRAKMADSFVSTAKIEAGAVTQPKRAALGQQLSNRVGTLGTFSTSSSTPVDATNLSVSITTTGRPVFIGLVPSGGGDISYISAEKTGEVTEAAILFIRGSTNIAQFAYRMWASGSGDVNLQVGPGPWHIDIPAAGTYTYKVQAYQRETGTTTSISCYKLIAFEL